MPDMQNHRINLSGNKSSARIILCFSIMVLFNAPVIIAQEQGHYNKKDSLDYSWERFSVSMGGFLTGLNSDIQIRSQEVGLGAILNVEEALGLETTTLVFRGEMEYNFGRQECPGIDDGGIEDDDPLTIINDGGLSATIEELIERGRCGGGLSICGGYDKILERVQGDGDYALVVVGDMFLSKGKSTRTRRTRELAMTIRDRLKAPVITADELQAKFMFGKRQALSLVGYGLAVALLYYLVFNNQEQVLTFLSGPIHEKLKWLAPLTIFMFVPVIAYLYGAVTGLALKLINID